MKRKDSFELINEMSRSVKDASEELTKGFKGLYSRDKLVDMVAFHNKKTGYGFAELKETLNKEFILAVDREDLMDIGAALRKSARTIYDVSCFAKNACTAENCLQELAYADNIYRLTDIIHSAALELKGFKKSKHINSLLIKAGEEAVNCERIYRAEQKSLYNGFKKDNIYVRQYLLDLMRQCSLSCEETAEKMEAAIIKNY